MPDDRPAICERCGRVATRAEIQPSPLGLTCADDASGCLRRVRLAECRHTLRLEAAAAWASTLSLVKAAAIAGTPEAKAAVRAQGPAGMFQRLVTIWNLAMDEAGNLEGKL